MASLCCLLVASGAKGSSRDIDKVKGLLKAVHKALCGNVGMNDLLNWTSLAMLDAFLDRPVAQRRDALLPSTRAPRSTGCCSSRPLISVFAVVESSCKLWFMEGGATASAIVQFRFPVVIYPVVTHIHVDEGLGRSEVFETAALWLS